MKHKNCAEYFRILVDNVKTYHPQGEELNLLLSGPTGTVLELQNQESLTDVESHTLVMLRAQLSLMVG